MVKNIVMGLVTLSEMQNLISHLELMEKELTKHELVLKENEKLQRLLAHAGQRLDAAARIEAMTASSSSWMTTTASTTSKALLRRHMVDTRLKSRFRTLIGSKQKWKAWFFDFEGNTPTAVHPSIAELLKITPSDQTDRDPNGQLYYIFVLAANSLAKLEIDDVLQVDG